MNITMLMVSESIALGIVNASNLIDLLPLGSVQIHCSLDVADQHIKVFYKLWKLSGICFLLLSNHFFQKKVWLSYFALDGMCSVYDMHQEKLILLCSRSLSLL